MRTLTTATLLTLALLSSACATTPPKDKDDDKKTDPFQSASPGATTDPAYQISRESHLLQSRPTP